MRFLPRALCAALFSILMVESACAQFRGNVGVGITSYSNAEGTDTSTADQALTPQLQLGYTFKFSPITSFDLTGYSQYDLYLQKPERSFLTLSFDGDLKSYLSNIDAIRAGKEKKATAAVVVAPAYEEIANALTSLADSTSALNVGEVRAALKKEALVDMRSDITTTLVAYASLLAEMGYTQSFKEVLTDELGGIKNKVQLLGLTTAHQLRYDRLIDNLLTTLDAVIAENDISPTASSKEDAERTDDIVSVAAEKDASIITLVSTESPLESFSYGVVYPREYLGTVDATTYATQLSVPLTLDRRIYRKAYDSYTYTTFRFQPRVDFYPSNTAGIGFDYLFDRTKFPDTSLYSFSEHSVRLDSRFELSRAVCLVAELGYGKRNYPHPMKITFRGGPGPKREVTFTAPSDYTRIAPGAALMLFPTERVALTGGARITVNPASNVTYLGGISTGRVTNSGYFGLASDESYIYEATGLFGGVNFLLPAELELGADVVHESRSYPPPPLPNIFSTRSDQVLYFNASLSKYFYYYSSFVSSLYPKLGLSYTKLTSNFDGFSYSDFSVEASISVGF